MNVVCIEVTPECNWTCAYCIAGTQKGRFKFNQKNFEDILKFIEIQTDEIVISGGEPGLLSESNISKLLDSLYIYKEKRQARQSLLAQISLNTNGLFLKKILTNKISQDPIYNDMDFRLHMFQDTPTRNRINAIKEIQTLNNLRKIPLYIEYQLLMTPMDDISMVRYVLKELGQINIIITPTKLSLKNNTYQEFSTPKVLRLYKQILLVLEEAKINPDLTIESFQEFFGMTNTKYKLHEITNEWKGLK